jgi:hypothetical protein
MSRIQRSYKDYDLIIDTTISGAKLLGGFNKCIIIDKYDNIKAIYYAKGTETAMIRLFRNIAKLCAENNNNITPDQLKKKLDEELKSSSNYIIEDTNNVNCSSDSICKFNVGSVIYDKDVDLLSLSDIYIIVHNDDSTKITSMVHYDDMTLEEYIQLTKYDIINKSFKCVGYQNVDNYYESKILINDVNSRVVPYLKKIVVNVNNGTYVENFNPIDSINNSNIPDDQKKSLINYINSLNNK